MVAEIRAHYSTRCDELFLITFVFENQRYHFSESDGAPMLCSFLVFEIVFSSDQPHYYIYFSVFCFLLIDKK